MSEKRSAAFHLCLKSWFFSFLIRSNSKHDFMNKSEEGNWSSPGHSHMAVKSVLQPGEVLSLCLYLWGKWGLGPCYSSWSTWNILGIKRFCLRKVSGPEDNSSIHQSWQKEYTCVYLWSRKGFYFLGKHTGLSPEWESCRVGAPPCHFLDKGGLKALEAKGSQADRTQIAEMPKVGWQLWV